MKLTWEEKIAKIFGHGYVVNLNKDEIHRLSKKHENCHHDLMTQKQFVTEKKAFKLIKGLYNGCAFCWKEEDRG